MEDNEADDKLIRLWLLVQQLLYEDVEMAFSSSYSIVEAARNCCCLLVERSDC